MSADVLNGKTGWSENYIFLYLYPGSSQRIILRSYWRVDHAAEVNTNLFVTVCAQWDLAQEPTQGC